MTMHPAAGELLFTEAAATESITAGVAPAPYAPPVRALRHRPRSRRVAIDIVGGLDCAGIVGGGLVPFYLFGAPGSFVVQGPILLQGALMTCLLTYLCLRHFGMYDTSRLDDLPVNPERVIAALMIAFIATLGLGIPSQIAGAQLWPWLGHWAASSIILVLAFRGLARETLRAMSRAGAFDTRIAIYGSGVLASRIADHVATKNNDLRLVGIFDDRTGARGQVAQDQQLPRVDGSFDALMRRGRKGEIDQIIIALPQSAEHRTAELARRLEQLPVSLHVVTHVASDYIQKNSTHKVSSLGPIGLLDIKKKPLSDWGRHVKSAEDFVLAALILVLILPVLALVALAVKLDSPGPVLFRQRRHGLNRRVIEVLKFRTMRVMENGNVVTQATKDDPRVTRVGAFLRRTSLDELPQFINVLRGEMSVIGPRPHALVHDDLYGDMLEHYANRHKVKPGITGWAQVNGFRGPTETADKMRARVDHDLAYIDNWSLWLDLKILAMTVVGGFSGKNAF
jgi:Undecaprenyl-phosphate glucose phosphotransferase